MPSFTTLAFALASAALASAQGLTVNTPTSVVQCQPVALSWSGGTGPYFLSIIPGGQPGAAALESFPQQSGNSYTWQVDLSAGTSITVQIKDQTGAVNYSQQVSVQASTTGDCSSGSSGGGAAAGGASSGSSTAAAAGSSAAAAGAATTSPAAGAAGAASGMATSARAATTSASAAAQSAGASIASAAQSATSSTTSSTSGASHVGAGLLTVLGGAFLALFA